MHRTVVRRDSARMDELLHEDFREIGRSGRKYSRQEILNELLGEATLPEIGVSDVSCNLVNDDTALLTYTSFQKNRSNASERGSRYTLRASLWLRQAGRWRLRFHQGTPMEESLD